MVAGLVEDHHVGLGQQQLGQHQAVLLAAAERGDRLVERLAAEPQAVENLLDAMVEVVGVLAMQFVLEMIVAAGQPPLLGGIGRLADGRGHFDRLVLQREQIGQGAAGFVVQGSAGLETRLLLQIADVRGGMDRHGAGVGFVFAGEDSQQRGLAAAVGPDQPDAIPGDSSKVTPARTGSGPNRFLTSTTSRNIIRKKCLVYGAGGLGQAEPTGLPQV